MLILWYKTENNEENTISVENVEDALLFVNDSNNTESSDIFLNWINYNLYFESEGESGEIPVFWLDSEFRTFKEHVSFLTSQK
jgi:hypothetical protein